ncbi:hypothetical protein GUJ93_ZPchr0002g25517 [Zizania palustris]|uniref:Uncharacterized protein n=1 Tax=Zizania palustris TaxID=103762 RepID=A0A8J5RMJ1_ZIZPA|nr:hypothetical protein GUJ93_ZPchr0002g25517 [Zizania palustris]
MGFPKVNTFHGLVGSESSKSQRLSRLGLSTRSSPRAAAGRRRGHRAGTPQVPTRRRGRASAASPGASLGRVPFVARPGRAPISPGFSALSRESPLPGFGFYRVAVEPLLRQILQVKRREQSTRSKEVDNTEWCPLACL